MKCPYCLSDVADEALACPHCTKDLYLFKPMMQRVADLEAQLSALPERQVLAQRVSQLESMLAQQAMSGSAQGNMGITGNFRNLLVFLILPLVLLLLGHGLITIVYDTKLLYLRLISIAIPAVFGYALMSSGPHKLLPWFLVSAVLALLSVIGMSYMTHLVDGTAVMPQNTFEWREFLEYGISISSSFLAGMILGRAAYIKHHRLISTAIGGAYAALVASTGRDKLDAQGAFKLMKALNDHISTIMALGSTALSVYTGLKGIVG
jgi:hypothetical protein